MAVNDASRFLHALFADCPPALRFYTWTLPGKESTWYSPDAVDAAVATVARYERQDVYVGVSLAERDRGRHQRVEPRNAAAIVGLWADVDIADERAHKKDGLPADEAAARDLVAAVGPEPTALVHSGHGLQAWWLFTEPWVFDTPAERDEAGALANRWNLTLRVRAAERALVVDSVFDLSRVMRVPGTTNWKVDPVAVRLLALSGRRRYAPADLEQYLADDAALSLLTARATYAVGVLRLVATANPNVDKLDALRDNDAKFRSSWERTRKDFTDSSPSSYDLSLATIAASVGWSDQEIADLIVAARRKHGDDLKLRQDYYARTIARARDDIARSVSNEEIETVREQVDRAAATGDARGVQRGRRELLDHLSRVLKIVVTRLVRYTQDPPRYRLETPVGSIMLGGAEVILSQTKMRAAIAGATGIVVPRFKAPKWDEIAQAMFAACEDEETGIESTDEGMGYSWLVEYLQDKPILTDRNEAATTATPFRDDEGGPIFVFGPPLRRWLWLSRGDRVTAGRMGEVLRAFGCEHATVNVEIDGKRTTRSAWLVPGLDGAVAPPGARRGRLGLVGGAAAPSGAEGARDAVSGH